jgi:hypothetical protein
MSKTKISEFSTTPGNNTDINGINIAEGCAPSGINNAIRELMSDLKEWQSGAMDVYVIPQGTAAAPGIQLYGDLDTGLYGFAANQLGVAVGGASAGYFSSDGWVGNVVATTVDLTNIEVTNIKAKDGTSSIALADSTGVATFSKPTVMSVDSASDALRITQIGAGNALLVEDSANPDTSPFVVTAAGLVGVGTLNPTRTIHVSAASGLPGITLESTSNGSSSSGVVVFNRTTTSTLTSQTIGSALWSHNLTDSTLVTAASIIVTGNNTAGSNTANMAIDAKTSTIMKVNGTEVANFASGGLNVTGTVDVTSIETTNIKAKDGTAAASIADSTGAITVTKDLTANGVTLGKGLGSALTNTALGRSALAANTVGDLNTAVGNLSLTSNTGGTGNTAVGHVAMTSHQGGSLNTAVGAGSLTSNLNGNNNTAIGQSALGTATGSNNTAVGSAAGSLITNGNKNTIIGNYDGNQGGLDIRTASNYIVLSDGDGNPRAYWNGADATFGGALDVTNLEVTNIKAKDGTASITLADSTGNVTVSPAFAVNGNTTLGDASTDTVQVNGYMGVGGAANTARAVDVSSSALSGTTQDGVFSRVTGTSGATGLIRGFAAQPGTAAAAFTVSDVVGFVAINPLKGAGSIITNAHGVFIGDHSQGTNNYGITSTVSSGANKWNIYVSGTAANYFAGQVGIGGTTLINTAHLTISGSGTGSVTGGGILSLFRPNTTVVAGSNFGSIYFTGADTTSNTPTTLAYIRGQASGTHDPGDNPTDLVFAVTADGTETVYEAMRLNQAGGIVTQPIAGGHTVFNENGVDADFRVESDTSTHALFVEGSSGNVGIGTSSPAGAVGYSSPTRVLGIAGDGSSNSTAYGAINLKNNRATPANNDIFAFVSAESDGSVAPYKGGMGFFADGAGGATGGFGSRFVILTRADNSASSPTERMRIDSSGALIAKPAAGTGAVFNEDGVDADFRVESDTSTHALFVQGSDGNVGIGTNSPNTNLEISTTVDPILRLNNSTNAVTTGADIGEIQFYTNDASTSGTGVKAFVKTVAQAFGANQGGADLVFGTAAYAVGDASEKMRIDKDGNVGIGNSSPTARLEVVTSSGTATAKIWSATNTTPIADLELQRGTNAWGVAFPIWREFDNLRTHAHHQRWQRQHWRHSKSRHHRRHSSAKHLQRHCPCRHAHQRHQSLLLQR